MCDDWEHSTRCLIHTPCVKFRTRYFKGNSCAISRDNAYDCVRSFGDSWRNQVDSFVQKGNIGIKVNDDIGNYFQTQKGLRQGGPMSPILFNIVADMLAILIGRAKEDGQVGGLVPPSCGWRGCPYYNTLTTLSFSWNMISQRLKGITRITKSTSLSSPL